MADQKKYGLIIKKKTKENQIMKKTSVFGDDSSDEEKAVKSNINVSLMKESQKKKQMKQTQIEIEKALQEDPTVYEYDSIYDDMTEKKKAAIPKLSEKDKKPKYIKGLLESAKSRKMEDERRMERKIQKEREQEGGEFQGKEEFVTSAYRKRVLELEEEERRLKKQEALDAANDVTKRSDLTMFYSNLLNQNVSMGGTFTAQSENSLNIDTGKDTNKSKHEEIGSKRKETSDIARHSRKDSRRNREDRDEGGHTHYQMDDTDDRHKSYNRKQRSSGEERSSRRPREEHKDDSRKSSHRSSERHREAGNSRKNNRMDDETRSSTSKDDKECALQEQPQETTGSNVQPQVNTKFVKRSTNETVSSARERYLERKRAREIMLQAKPTDASDED